MKHRVNAPLPARGAAGPAYARHGASPYPRDVPTSTRRLLAVLAAAMVVDTAGYSAITPLLPHFADTYAFGPAGAGLLTAAYPIGIIGAALPASWLVARWGARPVTLGSLGLVGLAALAFGLAPGLVVLAGARAAQGVAAAGLWSAALAWATAVAPADRRSEALGTVVGAAIVGAVGGPVLGALADWAGTAVVFSAFVAVPAALAWFVARAPAPPAADHSGGTGAMRAALGDRAVRLGMWLMLVPSVGFAVVSLLVPLRLDAAGWGAAVIAGVFLVTAGAEAAASPIAGRAADRRGPLVPAWVALAFGGIGLVALAAGSPWATLALVPVTGAVLGSLWTPAMTLLSDGARARGVDPAFGFGLANLVWGLATAVGGTTGGAVAEATGAWVAFVAVGVLALASALVVARRARLSTPLHVAPAPTSRVGESN